MHLGLRPQLAVSGYVWLRYVNAREQPIHLLSSVPSFEIERNEQLVSFLPIVSTGYDCIFYKERELYYLLMELTRIHVHFHIVESSGTRIGGEGGR